MSKTFLRTFTTTLRSNAPNTSIPAGGVNPYQASSQATGTAKKVTEISKDNPDYASLLATRALAQAGLNEQDDNRRRFLQAKIYPPHTLEHSSLYPQRRVFKKLPLVGPKKAEARRQDPFYLTNTNPIDQAINPRFVGAFIDGLGRIKSRRETGLTLKSQRSVSKMVRRARAMGVIGVFNKADPKVGYGGTVVP